MWCRLPHKWLRVYRLGLSVALSQQNIVSRIALPPLEMQTRNLTVPGHNMSSSKMDLVRSKSSMFVPLSQQNSGTRGVAAAVIDTQLDSAIVVQSISQSSMSFIHSLPPTKEEVNVFARVCLSVCLLARLLKNACMDLDEMLRVDRCRDMDELVNF